MLPYLLSAVRISVGLIFFQHGAEKIWGFANGRIDHNFLTMHGFAGPLEVAGGALLILGLFTRTTAFILCGEMAVAYFLRWAPRGFWPISNGGEEAVICCFLFLWLVTAGAGPWSVDSLIGQSPRRVVHESNHRILGRLRALAAPHHPGLRVYAPRIPPLLRLFPRFRRPPRRHPHGARRTARPSSAASKSSAASCCFSACLRGP